MGDVPDVCPHCGAENAIEIDTTMGEAACTMCATVVTMGMYESENTRFDADTTMIDVDDSRRQSLKDQTSTARGLNKAVIAARYDLTKMRERTIAPNGVVDTAETYYRTLLQLQQRDSVNTKKKPALVIACFLVAAAKWHFPIQAHELDVSAIATESELSTHVSNIVRQLNLENQLPSRDQQFEDLSRVYLQRCRLNVAVYHNAVTAVSLAYNEITGATASMSVAVAVGLYLTLASKDAAPALGVPLSGKKPMEFFKEVADATHHDGSMLNKYLQLAKGKVPSLAARAKAMVDAKVAPADAAAGEATTKAVRGRDEKDEEADAPPKSAARK